jgi:hypothetical protein
MCDVSPAPNGPGCITCQIDLPSWAALETQNAPLLGDMSADDGPDVNGVAAPH